MNCTAALLFAHFMTDIVVCGAGGRYIEVEAKSTTGKQREAQREHQQHIERLGGIYILARSTDDLIAHQEAITGRRAQW